MADPFRYCFRFCCDPGFNDRAELHKLMDFVDQALVDDVMVFVNVEEINTGHFDQAEQDVYLNLLKALKPPLAQRGVTLSVNHWHSLMHADLGKRFRPGQDFDPMVDVDGRAAENCVCPLSQGWRSYIGQVYARYAALHPDTVWVEDDFRFHNHDPLHWGGCFCQQHLELVSRRLGRPVTREGLIQALLRPGSPAPERAAWLEACRESLEGAAQAIAQGVHSADPSVKIGLMSSVPYIHAAEGRDWKRLLSIFAGENAPVSRIHLPAYQEMAPSKYLAAFHMVSMANRALLPEGTEVYPELENYPYSRFSKSLRFTRFQLLSALAMNVSGMTIDLYDLNGRGIIQGEGWEEMLSQVKPYLNRMNASGVFRLPPKGVCVLTDPASSAFVHTDRGEAMEELYPQEVFWAGLLPAMGIPCYIGVDPAQAGGVAAVSGQYFRSLDRERIRELFRDQFVLLTGDALMTLLDMGLGALAGVKSARWMRQNQGEYAFEQACDGRLYTGVPQARASAIISASDALSVEYASSGVETLTMLCDSFRTPHCPGTATVEGRALIFPFGRFDGPQEIPPMFRNDVRQQIIQGVLARSGRMNAPMVQGMPDLTCYAFDGGDRQYLYLVNGSLDEARELRLANLPQGDYTITMDPSAGPEASVSIPVQDGTCTLPVRMGSMESALLTIETNKPK